MHQLIDFFFFFLKLAYDVTKCEARSLAFFLGDGADVVGDSLQGVDEHVQVGAVNVAPHEELQIRRAVLGPPPRATLDVEEFRLESLRGERYESWLACFFFKVKPTGEAF